ncbi:hypothetical protein BH20ACT5_BH20ACT5_04610 [soil metagenome]
MSPPPRSTRSRSRRPVALFASGTALLASAVVGFVPGTAGASSHREAPLIVGDPQHDNTDTYAFVSPDDGGDTVTLIANWIPFQEPNGGPNFYPWAEGSFYDINIDADGDGAADQTYRWEFTNIDTRGENAGSTGEPTFLYNDGPVTSFEDAALRFKQTYTLTEVVSGTVLVADAPSAPSNVGPASMPDYQALRDEAVVPVSDGEFDGLSFAGQADDSFFLDLRIFDLVYGGDLSEVGQDTLACFNVNSVALKLPKEAFALNNNADGTDEVANDGSIDEPDGKADVGNPVIGVWSTTSKQSIDLATGDAINDTFTQVSRLGMPLVNEVVLPADLKDTFNAIDPTVDATVDEVVDRILDPEVPKLIEIIYGIPAPPAPRLDVAEIFLSGVTTQLDGQTLFGVNYEAPIQLDLNSQAMNADVDAATFVPSEMTRLNMSIPPTEEPDRLGVLAGDLAGFPNGRRLIDDVVDIEIQVLEGFFVDQDGDGEADGIVEALAAGDAVNENDVPFLDTFPYVALPNNEVVNECQGGGGSPPVEPTDPPVDPTDPPTDPTDPPPGDFDMPIGGVETGEGGLFGVDGAPMLPLVSGAAALVLLGAGAGALIRGRRSEASVQGAPDTACGKKRETLVGCGRGLPHPTGLSQPTGLCPHQLREGVLCPAPADSRSIPARTSIPPKANSTPIRARRKHRPDLRSVPGCGSPRSAPVSPP